LGLGVLFSDFLGGGRVALGEGLEPLFEEAGEGCVAEVFAGRGDLLDGRDGAEGGVEEDFFEGFGLIGVAAGAGLGAGAGAAGACSGAGFAGKVGGGDLQAVEEEAGAALVEVAGGDAAEDFKEGELDGGAVFEGGEDEGVGGIAGGFGAGGAAASVVVEAEGLSAQGGAAAAVAGGVDVAAAEAFGCGLVWSLVCGSILGVRGFLHGGTPPRT